MSSTNDDVVVQSPHHLIFGQLGIASFIILFFFLLIAFTWFLTLGCPSGDRFTIRGVLIGSLVIIIIILFYADKQPEFISSSMEPHIYDHSIIPRVAVALVMAIFGIVAAINLIDHFGESKKLTSINQEITALWQD